MKVLVTAWPILGHLFPNMAVAQALRDRGHEIAFYTGAERRSMIESQGFVCFPFKRIDGAAVERMLARGYYGESSALRRAQKQKEVYRALFVGTLQDQLDDLEEILPVWQPDVIMCDPTMWSPMLVLWETQEVPVAVLGIGVGAMVPGPDAPLAGPGLPSPRSWWIRVLSSVVGAAVQFLTADIRRAASDFRQRNGLAPLSCTVAEHLGRIPLYLVTSVPALDFDRSDLAASVRYVGDCLWSPPEQQAPSWIDDLPHDRPWVYVTEGTLRGQRPLVLDAAAKGLTDLPVQVVMTAGGRHDPAALGLGSLAQNIALKEWVPDAEFIPRAAVVVTVGGAGTVLTALQAGVPLVVVPTEWDKPDNAQRVVESGAGLRLSPRRCTPRRLRTAVERVLNEPSFRQNAQRLAADLERYGGAARAAELLEELGTNGGRVIMTLPTDARGQVNG